MDKRRGFPDHFSERARTYAKFRPQYPPELFEYLARLTPGHELAWDCATGNGQAALGMANLYDRIIATDASAEQIANAVPHERITYRVEPAEQTSLSPHSVDLITVAVGVHWFNLPRFYQEVRRVLKLDGVIAVWTYHRPVINPDLDVLIAYLEEQILGRYWPEQIRLLQDHYRSLPFPFVETKPPAFTLQAEWFLDQLVGFIDSWSAVRLYEQKEGIHPLKQVWDDFTAAWGDVDAPQTIRWPLYMRVGRGV